MDEISPMLPMWTKFHQCYLYGRNFTNVTYMDDISPMLPIWTVFNYKLIDVAFGIGFKCLAKYVLVYFLVDLLSLVKI